MNSFVKKILVMSELNKSKLILFIVFFLILSIFDLIGISMISPFIDIAFNNDTKKLDKLMTFFNNFSVKNNLIYYFGIFIALIFFLKLILYVFCNYLIFRHCFNNGTYLRENLLSKYFTNINKNLSLYSNSDLIYRITNLVAIFSQGFILNLLKTSSEIIVALSILIFLAFINLKILSLSIIIILIILFVFDFLFNSKLKSYGQKSNIFQKNMVNTIKEAVMGSKEISILGAEDYFLNNIKKNSTNYAKLNIYHHLISGLPRYLIELIIMLILVSSILITLYLNDNPIDNISTFSLFGIAALRLAPCATQIIRGITNIKFNINSVDQLYELFSEDIKKQNIDKNDSLKFNSIKINSLNFKYDENESIFENLDFALKKGEKICILGKSGSGKTTFLDILLGFKNASKGDFYLNDEKIYEKDIKLFRDIFSYIPQGFFIIKGSLFENISFNQKPNLSEIENVLNLSNLSNTRFDLDTYIDEEGTNISGGQKQRISLARSFYHKRDIIILDESTNALDEDTEKNILDNLASIKKELTLIMVAHKIKSFDYFDKVYEIRNKKLIKIK